MPQIIFLKRLFNVITLEHLTFLAACLVRSSASFKGRVIRIHKRQFKTCSPKDVSLKVI